MSAARQKGTAFETSLLPLLREWYPEAERRPLQGEKDKGDYHLPGEARYALQAKNQKTMVLSSWVDDAAEQALNLDPSGHAVGVVVHKRRGVTDPYEQYVTMKFGDFLWLVNRER
jgi:hypothetical protein